MTSWDVDVQGRIQLLICRLLVPLTVFITQNIQRGCKFVADGRSISFWWKLKDRQDIFWNLEQHKMSLFRWWNCTLSLLLLNFAFTLSFPFHCSCLAKKKSYCVCSYGVSMLLFATEELLLLPRIQLFVSFRLLVCYKSWKHWEWSHKN